MNRRFLSILAVAGMVVLSACTDESAVTMAPQAQDETAETPESDLMVADGLVFTPSGVVFAVEEWDLLNDATRARYLVEEGVYLQEMYKTMESRRPNLPEGMQAITGNAGPSTLCHQNDSYICGRIVAFVPGATATLWNSTQWSSASAADFAQFDLIYLGHTASSNAAIVGNKDTWGAAATGRLVLTGVHFEHCGGSASYGPCRVLIDAAKWVHGDGNEGTGVILSTQFQSTGPQIIPSIPPWNGVSYSVNGGGFDLVRITDPGHATMQTSTDASLSNFNQSSHSIFGTIGGFTSVAEVCDVYRTYPGVCPGNFRPHILVTSVAVADQDGDGVPDALDNCPTVGNADQADANNNGIGDACESAPTVTISPTNPTVSPGGSITFTSSATDSDDPLSSLTYEWRVNGIVQSGETGTSFTASFTADATVRVTVRDPGFLSGFDETDVTIISNQPPVADAGGPYSGDEGSAVSFDGSGSSDPDGDSPLTYDWTFVGGGTATGVTASETWADDGSYQAALTVTDPSGAANTSVATVTINNVAPSVTVGAMSTELTGDASTGSGSFSDPGADTWTITVDYGDGTVETTSGAPEGAFALSHAYADDGEYTVTVTVDDGDGGVTTATTTATILNRAPTADASGSDQLVECTDNDGGTSVSLVGAGSDPDGTVESFVWTDEAGNTIATGANASVSLEDGTHVITLTVTDDDGATASDDVTIVVEDTTAPELTFSMDVTEIWPPNHKMVTVASGIGAWDACDDAPTLVIDVTSNEPINDIGDGNTDADWAVIDNGDGTFDVQVRAERQGPATGRIYTVTVTATDGSGNSSTASGEVTVPHDTGNGKGKGR